MSICERCKVRETGSFEDGTKLDNYVCQTCRDKEIKYCPHCGKSISVKMMLNS